MKDNLMKINRIIIILLLSLYTFVQKSAYLCSLKGLAIILGIVSFMAPTTDAPDKCEVIH